MESLFQKYHLQEEHLRRDETRDCNNKGQENAPRERNIPALFLNPDHQ